MELRSWKSNIKPRGTTSNKRLKNSLKSPLFWERFAIVVSMLALIVSTFSTVAAWNQASISRKQLVAADRNRNIEALLDSSRSLCALIEGISISPTTPFRQIIITDPKLSIEERLKRTLIANMMMSAVVMTQQYYRFEDVEKMYADKNFVDQHKVAMTQIASSFQKLRLWSEDKESQSLQDLIQQAASYISIEHFIDMPTDTDEQNGKYRLIFQNYQEALSACKHIEAAIVNWSKGKDASLPDAEIIPVYDKKEAEEKFSREPILLP